jgi:hypothetical protein
MRLIIEKVIISKDEVKIMHCISPKILYENCQLSSHTADKAR